MFKRILNVPLLLFLNFLSPKQKGHELIPILHCEDVADRYCLILHLGKFRYKSQYLTYPTYFQLPTIFQLLTMNYQHIYSEH